MPKAEDDGSKVEIDWVRNQESYDDLEIRIDKEDFEEDFSFEVFRELYAAEFGLYYDIVSMRNAETGRWISVDDSLEKLVELYEREGLRHSIRRILRGGAHIRMSGLAVLKAKSGTHQSKNTVARLVTAFYRDLGVKPLLREHIDDEIEALVGAETPGAGDIITLLESRQSVEVQTASLAIGTVVGLGVGAGLTAALA